MKHKNKSLLPRFVAAALSKLPKAAALLLSAVLVVGGAGAHSEGESPKAAASIAPLHSLLAGVMGEEPLLLIDAGQSPHRAQLAPSKVRALHHSDIFFHIGGGGEGFSARLLHSYDGRRIAFVRTIATLPNRRPNFLSGKGGHRHKHGRKKHDDDHRGHDKHDDHDDDEGDHHKHDEHDDDEHKDDHRKHGGHDDDDDDNHRGRKNGKHGKHGNAHRGHRHGIRDIHIWLDIDNARQMVRQMANALIELYPSKRETYLQNAAKTDAKLVALDAEIAAVLADVKGKDFAVAHDAYQYFERRYDLSQPVALRGGFGGGLSAKRLRAARAALQARGIKCVLSEPQLPARHLRALVEDTDALIGVADPLGADIPPGEEQYFVLMRALAKSFAECLRR